MVLKLSETFSLVMSGSDRVSGASEEFSGNLESSEAY